MQLLYLELVTVIMGFMHHPQILWFVLYATQTVTLAHQEQAQAAYLARTQMR